MSNTKVVKKPIVILTTFWEADKLLEVRQFCHENKGKTFLITMDSAESNQVRAYSIALSSPNFSQLPSLQAAFKGREDVFCPTYDILMDYKKDKDWSRYTSRYWKLLRERKPRIKEWAESLEEGVIYLLCCWENTSKTAHCHRQLMFDAFKNSTYLKTKLIPIYRDGGNIIQRADSNASRSAAIRNSFAQLREVRSPSEAPDDLFGGHTYDEMLAAITPENTSSDTVTIEGDTITMRTGRTTNILRGV